MTPEEKDARVERALALHHAGFNCAQSVGVALADLTDVDENTMFRLMEGFGGGMGGFTETCGALAGGAAVIGYRNSAGTSFPKTKGSTYKQTRTLVANFAEANGSTLCPDLKGLRGGPVLRSCDGCVADGVRMALDVIEAADAAAPANRPAPEGR